MKEGFDGGGVFCESRYIFRKVRGGILRMHFHKVRGRARGYSAKLGYFHKLRGEGMVKEGR